MIVDPQKGPVSDASQIDAVATFEELQIAKEVLEIIKQTQF